MRKPPGENYALCCRLCSPPVRPRPRPVKSATARSVSINSGLPTDLPCVTLIFRSSFSFSDHFFSVASVLAKGAEDKHLLPDHAMCPEPCAPSLTLFVVSL